MAIAFSKMDGGWFHVKTDPTKMTFQGFMDGFEEI